MLFIYVFHFFSRAGRPLARSSCLLWEVLVRQNALYKDFPLDRQAL